MGVTADCLEQACPDVGGPYRQRILSLRSRLVYELTREAIKESTATLDAELKDYASLASKIISQRSVELERGILALGDIVEIWPNARTSMATGCGNSRRRSAAFLRSRSPASYGSPNPG